MIIPTVHTKATFTAQDVQSNMHFSCKSPIVKTVSKDVWSHAPIKRGNR